MQYGEFLQHIYQKYSGNVKLELDRMIEILNAMHQPQASYPGFHIAGTNGKGSVCASLEALCRAQGYKTGLNTSPHLIDYTERFRIDGKDTDFETILGIYTDFEELFDRCDASFFEITTAIAFELFRRAQIDIGIIEVGLGGRLDATNLFTPDITAITSIGLDHVKTLGPTLELIAAEKAGIIKSGIPLLTGNIDPSPLAVISEVASQRNAPHYRLGKDFGYANIVNSTDGIRFDYYFGDIQFGGLHSNLIGVHQANNLSIALTAFILYRQKQGLPIAEEIIRNALANIHWAGRMQLLGKDPYIYVDGAHNLQGINALATNIAVNFPSQKVRMVVSILADKDYVHMLQRLAEVADVFYIAQNESDRAATVEQQSSILATTGKPYFTAESVVSAYQMALKDSLPEDVIICGGSLYTVGEILCYHRNGGR